MSLALYYVLRGVDSVGLPALWAEMDDADFAMLTEEVVALDEAMGHVFGLFTAVIAYGRQAERIEKLQVMSGRTGPEVVAAEGRIAALRRKRDALHPGGPPRVRRRPVLKPTATPAVNWYKRLRKATRTLRSERFWREATLKARYLESDVLAAGWAYDGLDAAFVGIQARLGDLPEVLARAVQEAAAERPARRALLDALREETRWREDSYAL